MVEICARQVARRYHRHVTWRELLATGLFALRKAARAFHEDQRTDFSVYARHNVRGRMIDSIRRDHFSWSDRVERAMERAYDVFSSHQDVEVDTFSDPKEKLLDGAQQGCDDALAAAIVAGAQEAQAAGPEAALLDRIAVREARKALLPADREVIRQVYDEEKTLDQVAVAVGVAAHTAQRRHARGLRRLRDLLVQ
jgi:RNA polymerase sigma factor (sigma-70 family)